MFCLHPHQDRYVVPVSSLTRVPDGVPPRRAVLTGTVETAVNALWEAGPRLGDRIAVIGAGLVGGMVATLLRTFPLARLQLVDLDPARKELADALGVDFAHPDDALPDCDIVFHCSASEGGLERSLKLVGDEGEIIEMSWYADRKVSSAAGGGLPRPQAVHPCQPGGRRGQGAPPPPHQRRPPGDRGVPADRTPSSTPSSRARPRSGNCPASSSGSRTARWRRCAMSSNTPQPPNTPQQKPRGNQCSA